MNTIIKNAHTASLRGKPAISCKQEGVPAFAGMTALGVREATPPLSEGAGGRSLDCFAPLAMTGTIND